MSRSNPRATPSPPDSPTSPARVRRMGAGMATRDSGLKIVVLSLGALALLAVAGGILAAEVTPWLLVAPLVVLALITARARARLEAERRRVAELLDRERAERVRQEFASRAGQLLEAPPDSMSMLDQVAGLAVPDMADLCVVDLLEPDGTLKGVVVRATDPADADALRIQRAMAPLDPHGDHPVAVAARTGRALLLSEMDPQDLSRFATSPTHLELMQRLRYRSAIVVPLSARGRRVGVFSLLRFGHDTPYDDEDFSVARDLARRAALAVDNARLFTDLQRAEGQLEAILKNLSEAVTVQDASGELVYANQAAADLMGSPSPEALIATPVAEIAARYWQFGQDGEPFPEEAYPGRLALHGERPEPVVLRQVDRTTMEERWVRLAAAPIAVDVGEPLAVTVTEDITDVVHAERTSRFLATASKLFGSSLDVASTIEKVAWAVVPEVADWCAVHLPDGRGRLRRAALAWMDPDQPEVSLPDPEPVLRAGAGRLLGSATLIAPLMAGDQPIGTITLATTGPGRRLGPGDLHLAEELGRRAGVAIENARVHEARSHIASTLQRSLLPPRLPGVPGLTTAARFRAAGISTEVGGDFYDLFPAAGGWMVVIGDVTGKGPEAAAITSLARYTLRTAALYEHVPESALERLNDVLLADPERRRLCTAICAHLSPQGAAVRIRLARAGHPPPYLLRAGAGAQPIGRPGTLLGAFEEVAWVGDDLELLPGDALVLYTDGVTDTTRGSERFGQDRLSALLAGCESLTPEEIARRIDAALKEFEEGPQRDDLAVLVLRADAVSR
jgi:PAS domain S-box-containing protein